MLISVYSFAGNPDEYSLAMFDKDKNLRSLYNYQNLLKLDKKNIKNYELFSQLERCFKEQESLYLEATYKIKEI
jgi:hypothetical protein